METTAANIGNELTHCKACGRGLDIFSQFSRYYGTCRTESCDRETITLELNDLAALTAEQVNDYLMGKSA